MAKLVDAADLGSVDINVVQVRLLPGAPHKMTTIHKQEAIFPLRYAKGICPVEVKTVRTNQAESSSVCRFYNLGSFLLIYLTMTMFITLIVFCFIFLILGV